MLHLVSYSYPPDNVPAAHRPYQLALALEEAGVPFRIYSRHGVRSTAAPWEVEDGIARKRDDAMVRRAFSAVSSLLTPILEADKALPWGARTAVDLWMQLIASWLREGIRPDVWTTCPGVTNLYVGALAAALSCSRLHVDLRDAIRGVNGARMPWLTRTALRYASTCSVVSDSLGALVKSNARVVPPEVVYNGVSAEAVRQARAHVDRGDRWIRVTYAGALYGGARPYEAALRTLQSASEALESHWEGIEVILVCRENLAELAGRYCSSRFRIVVRGEVAKHEALEMCATSDINMVLIGDGSEHRCTVPLKMYDLLGVGRPILYYGPGDSDGRLLLDRFAPHRCLIVDSGRTCGPSAELVAKWVAWSRNAKTSAITEPGADSQSRKIIDLIQPVGSAAVALEACSPTNREQGDGT